FLMLPQDLFVPGLAAFLVAHLCYVAGFWSSGPTAVAFLVSVIVVVLVVVPLARTILGAITRAGEPGELRIAVALYITGLPAMLATGLATGTLLAAIGAALFVASDSMIAWARFVRRLAWAPVAIMVTYHLGQAGLVASLLR